MADPKLEFLTPKNSALVLIDYQKAMFAGVASGDRSVMFQSALSTANAARELGVPAVLTSIYEKGNGEFIKEISGALPGVKVHEREIPGFDAFEDGAVWGALKKTGRRKVVMAGLWTSMCFAYTAIHGVREGLEIYGLMDAAGDASRDAHRYGVERMLQIGVVPTTCLSVVSEWMHDWGNPKVKELKEKAYGGFDAMLRM